VKSALSRKSRPPSPPNHHLGHRQPRHSMATRSHISIYAHNPRVDSLDPFGNLAPMPIPKCIPNVHSHFTLRRILALPQLFLPLNFVLNLTHFHFGPRPNLKCVAKQCPNLNPFSPHKSKYILLTLTLSLPPIRSLPVRRRQLRDVPVLRLAREPPGSCVD